MSDTTVAILNQKASVFDEENYDEDEELVKEDAVAGYVEPSSAGYIKYFYFYFSSFNQSIYIIYSQDLLYLQLSFTLALF